MSQQMSPTPRNNWFVLVGVPIIAAILGAIVTSTYPAIADKAFKVFFGEPFGAFVILVADDEDNGDPSRGFLELKHYDGTIWGTRYRGAEKYRYNYTGYLKNGFIVLAYRSEESTRNGYGEYFLAANSVTGKEYVGRAQVNTCSAEGQRVMDCNAVFVKAELGSREESDTLKKYKDYLGAKCREISFREANVAEKRACPASKVAPLKPL